MIPHLPAGVGIDDGAIKNDLAGFASSYFVDQAIFGDDGFNTTVVGGGGEVKIRLCLEGFGNFGVSRICSVFMCALPGSSSSRALLLHCAIKTCLIQAQTSVTNCVANKIER